MSDRIVLYNMVFQGRHGWYEHEHQNSQRFEVDVELVLDLRRAGASDDLAQTIDYADVFATTRRIVESTTHRLLESLAEAISRQILAGFPTVDEVVVRIRKPEVDLGGPVDFAGVEIRRGRTAP